MNICIICKKEFEQKSKRHNRKTCSLNCNYKYFSILRKAEQQKLKQKLKPIYINCIVCNKIFQPRVRYYKNKTCSKNCLHIYSQKVKDIFNNCIICNILFKQKRYYKNKTCSNICRWKLAKLNNSSKKRKLQNSLRLKGVSYKQRYGEEKAKIIIEKQHRGTKGLKQSKETKLKKSIAQLNLHKVTSLETKLKIIETKKQNLGKIKIGFKSFFYNNQYYRSSWEIKFVKWCEIKNIKFIYEPELFILNNNKGYIPDFYLPELNKYVEVKGWLNEESIYKMDEFTKQGYELIYIDSTNINNINLDLYWKDVSLFWYLQDEVMSMGGC